MVPTCKSTVSHTKLLNQGKKKPISGKALPPTNAKSKRLATCKHSSLGPNYLVKAKRERKLINGGRVRRRTGSLQPKPSPKGSKPGDNKATHVSQSKLFNQGKRQAKIHQRREGGAEKLLKALPRGNAKSKSFQTRWQQGNTRLTVQTT